MAAQVKSTASQVNLPRRAPAAPVDPMLKPTIGGLTLGALSTSTGAVLVDGLVGAGVGYLIAPKGTDRTGYTLGGALAVGLAGGLGLLGLVGYRLLSRGR